MKEEKKEMRKKKLYEKPRIREIKLEIEEAVLAACKTAAAKNGAGCFARANCGSGSRISALGS
jgi:hypothetical protein